jgi:alpha-glucosidase
MKIVNYEVLSNNLVKVNYDNQSYFVKFITESIIEFYQTKNSAFRINPECKNVNLNIEYVNDVLYIKSDVLNLEVYDNFITKIYDKNNNLICSDYENLLYKEKKEEDLSILELEGHKIIDRNLKHNIQVNKKMVEDEVIFGLGEKTGFLNKRNYEYEMWNSDIPEPHVDSFKALYKSIPFYMSLKEFGSYGIFFDNTYKSFFNIGKEIEDCLTFGSDKGDYNYYFIYGRKLKDVVEGYTYLTGKVPMPQRWTLGHHQCRWSYETKEEVIDIKNHYRNLNIPCDVIYLDIDYMDNYKVFTYDNNRFPKLEEFIKELNEEGFRVVTIIDPGVKVEDGYFVYDEAIKNSYVAQTPEGKTYINRVWPGDSVYPSFVSSKVRDWWQGNVKHMVDMNVSGIWNDMNEPASFNGPLPNDVVFYGDNQKHLHEEVHNVYGHFMSVATYEGLKKHTNKRPFVITRACFAGSQKYSTVWTGDNHSLWAHLQMCVPMLCNLGLSGFAFNGCDVGGFGSDCTPELLARWVQVGCFLPLFRNHSAKGTRHQEPWTFNDNVTNIYRKYVNLRYQLIPYYYDLFHEHQTNGLPPVRPLVLHYENDKNTHNLNDEFLLGDKILVSPVLNQGDTKKLVYLPEGKWVSYWDNKVYDSGYHIIDAPLDTCPIFIKNDSIIPNYEISQYTKDYDTLVLNLYGRKGTYTHYHDNGENFEYLEGKYNLYQFSFENDELNIELLHNDYKLYNKIIVNYNEKVYEINDVKNNLKVKL